MWPIGFVFSECETGYERGVYEIQEIHGFWYTSAHRFFILFSV